MLTAIYHPFRMVVVGVLTAAALTVATAATALTVDQFLANPNQALQENPDGGADLISLIRQVAVSHPEALATIMGLLPNANTDQQAAIGTGLGQAAQIVVRTNPDYAAQIQQAVAAAGLDAVSVAFAAATGNTAIGATGGGGGGGGTGGQTGNTGFAFGGSNTGGGDGGTGNQSTNNQQNSLLGGGGGTGGASANSVSIR